MARKPRIQFPGAFYHVIAQGKRGQKIFRDFQDYERYLSFLREYKVRFGFFGLRLHVDAYPYSLPVIILGPLGGQWVEIWQRN